MRCRVSRSYKHSSVNVTAASANIATHHSLARLAFHAFARFLLQLRALSCNGLAFSLQLQPFRLGGRALLLGQFGSGSGACAFGGGGFARTDSIGLFALSLFALSLFAFGK